MKIAIAGATSFIGRHLLQLLIREGHEVIAIIRPGRKNTVFSHDIPNNLSEYSDSEAEHRKLNVIELDISEYSRIGTLTGPCDCFIDLAWTATRGEARNDHDLQEYAFLRSKEAVHSMLETGCGTIVTAGSQAEYGPQQYPVDEQTPPRPNTEYGRYKLQLFESASRLSDQYGARLIEPRYFSLYGPGDFMGTMVTGMTDRMLRNEKCELTLGIQLWDFLHIRDASNALWSLIQSSECAGVYNFGSGDCRPLRAFVEEMKEVLGSNSELIFGAVPYPRTGMVSICPVTRRLESDTGWKSSISFADGIREVAAELRERK